VLDAKSASHDMPMKRRLSCDDLADADNPWSKPTTTTGEQEDTRWTANDQCPLCSKSVTFKSWPRHMDKIHPDALHKCPVAYCGYVAPSPKEACAHLARSHSWHLVRCPECPLLLFSCRSALWRHDAHVHAAKKGDCVDDNDDDKCTEMSRRLEQEVYSGASVTPSLVWLGAEKASAASKLSSSLLAKASRSVAASTGISGQDMRGASPW